MCNFIQLPTSVPVVLEEIIVKFEPAYDFILCNATWAYVMDGVTWALILGLSDAAVCSCMEELPLIKELHTVVVYLIGIPW